MASPHLRSCTTRPPTLPAYRFITAFVTVSSTASPTRPLTLPARRFITAFVTVFATAIAITKDLPDVEGDRQHGIETFATRLGVRRISWLGTGLLLANYVGAVVAAAALPGAFNVAVMVPAHLVLAGALVFQTLKLDAAGHTAPAIAAYYRFVWNLFYAEYALLPWI